MQSGVRNHDPGFTGVVAAEAAGHRATAQLAAQVGAEGGCVFVGVAQPVDEAAQVGGGEQGFFGDAAQVQALPASGFTPPLYGAADAHQAEHLQVDMSRLELVQQHLPGHRAMRRQALEPGQQAAFQTLFGVQTLQIGISGVAEQGQIGAVEPGFHQVVLVAVVMGDSVQADVERGGDVEQVQALPAADIGQLQGGIEDMGRIGWLVFHP